MSDSAEGDFERARPSRASIVDWKRLLLALPLLVVVGALLYFLVLRDDAAADTTRAVLADTPPGAAESVGVAKGQLARDFIATAPDGTQVRLSELRGKPLIVNFWASWCTSCLAELPEFKALQQRLGVENLHIVAINSGEDADTARRFLDELGLDSFRVGLDPSLVVSDAYGVFGLPTSIFIDAEGIVRATYAGHIQPETLETFVQAARSGDDAPDPDARLRVVTTVAREHVLEVRVDGATLDLRAKSLRCDDSHCADAAIDAIIMQDGVRDVHAYQDEDPARVVVEFDPEATSAEAIVERVTRALAAYPDPLYERPLEVVWR